MNNKSFTKITSFLKIFTEQPYEKRRLTSKKNLKIIKNILKKNKKKIVNAISKDIKKSIQNSKTEFDSSMVILNFVIDNFKNIKKEEKYLFKNGEKGIVSYEPVGVVAFITPWNYPLLTIFERLPFSLACGCSAILKPSEFNPNFSRLLIKLFNSNSDLKKCLRVMTNLDQSAGQALCKDQNISLISFVGSTLTGKKISKQCSLTLKKTNLELGGKNAAIICKTSNLDFAIPKIISAIFENGGQACVAISRLIINEDLFDEFIKKITSKIEKLYKMNKLKIQIPSTKSQKKKVSSIINYIKSNYSLKSIKIFNIGSKKFTPIFVHLKSNKNFFLKNEFFFPIVTIEKFKDTHDCVEKVNSANYGLATYVFSSNKFEINDLTNRLQSGRMWVNSSLKWNPNLPVGGFKLSGKGRDMGKFGFNTYLTTKSLYLAK